MHDRESDDPYDAFFGPEDNPAPKSGRRAGGDQASYGSGARSAHGSSRTSSGPRTSSRRATTYADPSVHPRHRGHDHEDRRVREPYRRAPSYDGSDDYGGDDGYDEPDWDDAPPRLRLSERIRQARSQRRFLISSGVLSTLVMMASGAVWATATAADRQIERVPDTGVAGSAPHGPKNILLLGVDKRDNLDLKTRNKYHLGKTVSSASLSDTMMVIRLSADHKRITVVNLPRDSWVTIPGHGQSKINAAYSLGGPKLAVKTVEAATGMRINHLIEVNVLGFIDVVDRLGGVEVCTPKGINDPKIKFKLPPGKHRLDGAKALSFARTRYSLRGDLDRIDNQQQFMSALLKTALSRDTLTNPAKLTGFVTSSLKAIKVDDKLSKSAILGLANELKNVDTDAVQFAKPPIASGGFQAPDGSSAVLWDAAQARALFEQIKRDQPLIQIKPKAGQPGAQPTQPAQPELPKPTIPAANITLKVTNGSGLTGKGATAATALRRVGFKVPATPGNTPQPTYAETVIQYGPDRADSAATIAAAIPGAKVEQVTTPGELTVIVGKSWAGAKPVKVTGAPPPTSTPNTTQIAARAEAKTATESICK